MTPTGLEQGPDFSGKIAVSPQGGAESGAVGDDYANTDPALAHIIHVWPSLPQHTRAAILALTANTSSRYEINEINEKSAPA